MHSKTLMACLFTLPCAQAVGASCIDGVNVEVGEECFLDGYQFCNPNCSQVVTCTDGAYQLTENCTSNYCYWVEDTATAHCLKEEGTIVLDVAKPEAVAVAVDSDPGCLPSLRIGASCASEPESEGQMRCDDTCNSIGICHDGVFQVNSPCAPRRCQWNAESELPFCV